MSVDSTNVVEPHCYIGEPDCFLVKALKEQKAQFHVMAWLHNFIQSLCYTIVWSKLNEETALNMFLKK